jgi:hypothetical protein
MTQRHCDLCSRRYEEETLDLGADELGFCNACARDRQVECENLEREAADQKDSEIDRVSRLVEIELTAPVGAKR